MTEDINDGIVKRAVEIEMKSGRRVKLDLPSVAERLINPDGTIGDPKPFDGGKLSIQGEKGPTMIIERDVILITNLGALGFEIATVGGSERGIVSGRLVITGFDGGTSRCIPLDEIATASFTNPPPPLVPPHGLESFGRQTE